MLRYLWSLTTPTTVIVIASVVGTDGVAERILVGQEALGKFLVDDADMRRRGGIRIREVAAGKDGHAESAEEVWPRDVAAHGSRAPLATSGNRPSTCMSLLSDQPEPRRSSMMVTDSTPGRLAACPSGSDRKQFPREPTGYRASLRKRRDPRCACPAECFRDCARCESADLRRPAARRKAPFAARR